VRGEKQDEERFRNIMKNKDFYSTAHIVVAAIRVLEHQNKIPPSVNSVCEILSFSTEHGNLLLKKLEDIGIIEVTEGGFGTRIFIKDHLKIEEIPRDEKEKSLKQEIEKFQNTKKELKQKIESFQAEKTEKQKQLFAEIESKLKKKLDKK